MTQPKKIGRNITNLLEKKKTSTTGRYQTVKTWCGSTDQPSELKNVIVKKIGV